MRIIEYEPDDELEINIVPMIDVIFAILAFFILSTLFLTRTEGLPVTLPTSTTAETQPQADISLTINGAGAIFIGQNPEAIAPNQLADQISRQLQPDQTTALITIRADAQVPHGRVIEVMDVLRTIDGISVGMATQPSQSAPASSQL